MTSGRWAYIKQLDVSPGRYLHISAYARMLPNPVDPVGLPAIPWIEKPGVTVVRWRKARGRNETNKPRWK